MTDRATLIYIGQDTAPGGTDMIVTWRAAGSYRWTCTRFTNRYAAVTFARSMRRSGSGDGLDE